MRISDLMSDVCSSDLLAAADHLAYASDYGRLDGNKDAVSVSILCVSEPRFAGGEEERRDLASHFPTDREAEVQVFQRIEADHIPGAIVGQPGDRKSRRLNSSHYCASRMPSSA